MRCVQFSFSNIKYIRQWHLFYSDLIPKSRQPAGQIAKQPVSQITQIPWWHNVVIISKCKSTDEAFYYVQTTIIHGWSRRANKAPSAANTAPQTHWPGIGIHLGPKYAYTSPFSLSPLSSPFFSCLYLSPFT